MFLPAINFTSSVDATSVEADPVFSPPVTLSVFTFQPLYCDFSMSSFTLNSWLPFTASVLVLVTAPSPTLVILCPPLLRPS